jgi:tetratricopeptide (TPR) repeat protein
MPKPISPIYPLLSAGLLILLCSGCSKESKKIRYLAQADGYVAAGKYDDAEIAYKNVLQLDPLDSEAISRLGLIYDEEGRLGQAYSYLKKGSELKPDNLVLRMKLGAIYMALGQLDEAKKEANYVLDHNPGDAEAPLLLANAINQQDDIEKVRQRLLQLPTPAPQGAPVLLALGTIEFRQRHVTEAAALFHRAEVIAPKSASAWSALASVYLVQNDRAQADDALQKAAELSPQRSPVRLQYAQFKFQTGDQAAARRLLEETIKVAPDYLPALVSLAQLALGEKKYDECAALLDKVLARDANLHEALLLSSQLALARGQNDQAIAQAAKTLKLYPKSALAAQQLGFAYLAGGRTDEGVASLGQSLSLAPGMTGAALTIASINIQKGNFSPAIISLKQVVQAHPELAQAWSLLAEAYRGQGNLTDALAVCVQMDQRFPASPQTPLFRGLIYLQQSRLAEARSEFEKALALSPAFIPAAEQLVSLDLRDRKFDAARQLVEAAIAKDPKQSAAYLLLARVLGAQGNTGEAETALKKAIELQPDSPNAYYILAILYYANKDHTKALADLKDLVAKNPKNMQALMMMGTLDEEIKDYPAARDAYEKLLAVNPRFAAALNNLAYIYAERFNQLDKGYDAAQRARDASPQEPHIADTLGWILYQRHEYPRALSLLGESAAKLPTEPEVLFHLGMARYMVGNADAARSALQQALALSGTFTGADTARQNLAVLNMSLKPGTGTREALEKMVRDHPEDPMVRTQLAAAYEQEGNPAKAITSYEDALKSAPNNIQAALSLIRLYAAHGETTKALGLAKATRELAPTNPDVAAVAGHLAYQTGDYDWALSLLQEAARSKTDDPGLLFDLANTLYSVGRIADAESAMRSALQAGPQFADAGKAQRFLELNNLASNPVQAVAATVRVGQILHTEPTDVPALMAWGTINEQKSDPKAAVQAYEKALGVFPDFLPAMRRLAILYSADPANNQKALDLGLKARQAYPEDAELARALGIVAYRQKDYRSAGNWLQETAAKQTDDATVQYYLGMARYQLKQTTQSRQALQRALDLGLAPDQALEVRKILAELH